MSEIEAAARAAKAASRALAALPRETKDAVLLDLAARIERERDLVLAANARDIAAAEAAGLAGPKRARLLLDERKLADMTAGVRQIAALPDPVHAVTRSWRVESGLRIRKVRTPLGVIAMIYEARPNVTIDAFALCFKAGNACLLKGGREANESNAALAGLARASLRAHGVDPAAITAVTTTDREEIRQLLTLTGLIDLAIPRGGEALIRFVAEHARVPTVQHYNGVCHIYVDEHADLDAALEIALTAKTSAPATCNAAECLLVHERAAETFVPAFVARAADESVEIRGDDRFRSIGGASVRPAAAGDFGTEFLDLVIAARVVGSIDAAIAHIAAHGSGHTEAIITRDAAAAERFCREVTSSCVLVNASTRFNDGFQLGRGAEIGISTSRLHAYGPMGLEELTIERYVVEGDGQVR